MDHDFQQLKKTILNRVNLKELISEKLELKQKSGIFQGLCPFHNEKSPSFTVYPDSYYCFGCKASGDAITFVRETQGLGFMDSLRHLATRAGVDPSQLESKRSNYSKESAKRMADDYKILSEAQNLFSANLQNELGLEAREYLLQRGFTVASIAEYGFGLSPSYGSNTIHQRLMSSYGCNIEQLASLSLAGQGERGETYDFFRNRITVPIHDTHGRTIGFGGRSIGDAMPKYKNSRETHLFDKSRTLYGWDKARKICRVESKPALLCEGYMDVLMLWQHGFSNATACMGTALTTHQVKIIGDATQEIILLFDGDTAGEKASFAAIKLALEHPEIRFRVCPLPKGEDPDSFVRTFGTDKLQNALDSSLEIFHFFVNRKLETATGFEKLGIVEKEIIPWIINIVDPLKREFLLNELATHSGIPVQTLKGTIEQKKKTQNVANIKFETLSETAVANQVSIDDWDSLDSDPRAHEIIALIYHAPSGSIPLETIESLLSSKISLSQLHLDFIHELITSLKEGVSPSEKQLSDWIALSLKGGNVFYDQLSQLQAAYQGVAHEKAFKDLLNEIEKESQKRKLTILKAQLSQSEPEDQLKILKEIRDLTKEKPTIA